MPYIFVRSVMNERNAQRVFEGTTTYIDFHLSFDQSRSHLYRELLKFGLAEPVNEFSRNPCYFDTLGSPGRKTYFTNAPAYELLNTLETCGYKVVAASSTPISSQYMWTLQGPVDKDVDQAHASLHH